MKRRITINFKDDESFVEFVTSSELLLKLVSSTGKTGHCLCKNNKFGFSAKKTKTGYSINGYSYYKEQNKISHDIEHVEDCRNNIRRVK